MTRFKFCGLRTDADVRAVNEVRPDYAGFVLAEGSRRRVTPEEAARLAGGLDDGIVPVAVLRDSPLEEAVRVAAAGAFGMIQLHGSEDDAYVSELRRRAGVRVMKEFTADRTSDAEASSADVVMFDGAVPGSGRTYDLSPLRDFGRPFFLAGGLTPSNVLETIKEVRPFAVDVSSGIESDGRKDPAKMRAFADAVRRADEV